MLRCFILQPKTGRTNRWIEGPVEGARNGWFGWPDLDQLVRSPFMQLHRMKLRFSLAQLMILTAAIAAYNSVVSSNAVLAWFIPAITFSAICTFNAIKSEPSNFVGAVRTASVSGILTMLIFGFGTPIMYAAFRPPLSKSFRELRYAFTPQALIMLVILGIIAAFIGAIIGSTFVVHQYKRNLRNSRLLSKPSSRSHRPNSGEQNDASKPDLHGFPNG